MKLAFVGDISLGEYYLSFGHGPKSYAHKRNIFENVKDVLSDADFVFGNLETPVSNIGLDGKNPESAVLRGDPNHLSMLADAGFKALSIANNHIVQHGEDVFRDTIKELEKNKIVPMGVSGRDTPIFEKNGIKVAIIVASDVPDNTDKNQSSYDVLDSEKIKNQIRNVKDKVNWVILFLHWGKEDCVLPNPHQMNLIDAFKLDGANFIIGHHPHIFYPIEASEKFLSAPSLGNFVFDLCWDERLMKSGVLHLELNASTFTAAFTPISLDRNGVPSISGSTKCLGEGVFDPYSNSPDFSRIGFQKNIFFIKNIFRGEFFLKIKFIFGKILNKIFKIKIYENYKNKD
ncbi:CapA family protein [Cellvibrio sp. BR]|uniref:CapA family protein n=1 Tax=Cellvibrio sp. BR TaxID=1134474 RepID=UPI0002EF8BA2|nr:CapA family protein [Cellvibrio sp. BR]